MLFLAVEDLRNFQTEMQVSVIVHVLSVDCLLHLISRFFLRTLNKEVASSATLRFVVSFSLLGAGGETKSCARHGLRDKKMKRNVKMLFATIIMAVTMVALNGCSKDEDSGKIRETGTIYVENLTSDPYNVNINNGESVFNLQSGYYRSLSDCQVGYYKIVVKQLSGYILYPTEKTYTGTLTKGGTLTVSIR